MAAPAQTSAAVTGVEHWAGKAPDVRLFLWEKFQGSPDGKPVIVWVHGSSMASTPTFDLALPGHPSVMDWFAGLGYDCWTLDMEGYGRSSKHRDVNSDVAAGADDLEAATDYIRRLRGRQAALMYGISSGALRAAVFAQRHPERVRRLALDAFVWTGEGSPTLAERRKKLAQWQASNRRPIDREFVRSVFSRDGHPDAADRATVEAFAEAILSLDDSIPNGTYVDMCANLPLVDPAQLTVPVLIMRGQWDGIAGFHDLLDFFDRLPNPDKHFAVMPGISHSSLHMKNWRLVYHLISSWFSQPEPVHTG